MTTTITSSSSLSCTPLLNSLQATLGEDLLGEIQGCKVLLVGAGGIGCELLKNLALSGFKSIQIIDLDTIDVSNLNRQLLFRSHHVGHPKCTTAAQVATDMAPRGVGQGGDVVDVRYEALHGNVCDSSTFHKPFVQQFDLVLNALDNLTARRRVNRLCLAASVPLIEAGTTGYLGQTNVISGGETACYECQSVETPKVYPICTIRATPSQPVHTIVWAKEFYKLLFGSQPQESMLFEDVAALEGEVSTYMDTVTQLRHFLQQEQEPSSQSLQTIIATLLKNLYADEIQKQLDLGRYKTALKKPTPVTTDLSTVTSEHAPSLQPSYQATDTACWTIDGCAAELQQIVGHANGSEFPKTFDKDHDPAMRFITAASNLRNIVFHIEPILQSVYSAKGIAGNIIPAIATTNAIAAGLQILQVYQVLAVAMEKKKQQQQSSETKTIAKSCCYNNIVRNPTRNGLVITAVSLSPPNPLCFVCRQGMVEWICNTKQWTLQHFLKRILQQELGLQEPSVQIGLDLIWEQGDDSDQAAFEVNIQKTLDQLPAGGVHHGTIIRVDDFSQDMELSIHVTHQDDWSAYQNDVTKQEEGGTATEEYPFLLNKGSTPAAQQQHRAPAKSTSNDGDVVSNGTTNHDQTKKTQNDNDDDDIVLVMREKRKVDDGEGHATAKRRKMDPPPADQGVILID